ncbi:MAG: 6-carboxytetrahydropterin synthase [Deltaproteobacteria bacterium]|nr:MAG: 6-carboxytetrahydropterin synthase [Deltaproteobacteria bacterium]
MFTVYKERIFPAAHQVLEPDGTLEPVHGHNWRLKVHVSARRLDRRAMVIDFHHLDRVMTEVLAPFEGRLLNDVPPFDDAAPTAENVARHIFEAISRRIDDERVRVRRVELWETEDACAIFEEPPSGA